MIREGRRLVVCGSRFGMPAGCEETARRILLLHWDVYRPIELCHGGGTGIDTWAEGVLRDAGVSMDRIRVFPPGSPNRDGHRRSDGVPVPLWSAGKVAGPRRTMDMCRFVKAHGTGWVLLFPGGAGTGYGAIYGRNMCLTVHDYRAAWVAPTR